MLEDASIPLSITLWSSLYDCLLIRSSSSDLQVYLQEMNELWPSRPQLLAVWIAVLRVLVGSTSVVSLVIISLLPWSCHVNQIPMHGWCQVWYQKRRRKEEEEHGLLKFVETVRQCSRKKRRALLLISMGSWYFFCRFGQSEKHCKRVWGQSVYVNVRNANCSVVQSRWRSPTTL